MNSRPLTISANYFVVVRGLRELHRLAVAGRQDSLEADAIRDATDSPWLALTEVERRRLSGLSEDLYSITDSPRGVTPELDARVQSLLIDVDQARHRGEWDRALELLRRWAASIEPSVLSYLRGLIWLEAGDAETAALFFEHALSLQPENGVYLAMLLDAANRFDSAEARRRAGEVLNSEGRQQPIVVAFAAEVVLGAVPHLPQADALSLSRSLIRRLEPAREAIEKADTGEFDLSTLTKICRLLGFCHECLGEHQAAVSDYSRGIAADPSNDVLLVHRGILLYGESARSLGDFELAIECGSPVIWPYYFLAHNALIGGLFEECRSLSERALEMEGSRTAKSELCEWLAISRSALGYPAEAVRQAFDRSIRLDPGNEQARRNLSTFESANPPIQPGKFELRDKTAIRLSSLYERRIRPAA